MPLTHADIKKMEQRGQAIHDADLAKARANPQVVAPLGGAALLMATADDYTQGEFSWADTSSALRDECIRGVNAAGNAISFAVNRAKTGGSVTILAGVNSPKLLAEGLDEANAQLRKIAAAYGLSIPT